MNRLLHYWTEGFPWWVIIGSAVAFYEPALFVPLKGQLPYYFALTMFGIGMTLETEDFKSIVRSPLVVLKGSLLQYTIMPLCSFVLAILFRLPPELALGLILAGSAPGAMSSNVMTYLVKGDVAYSVSLTTVSTLLAPLLTPALTFLLASTFVEIDFIGLFKSIIYTVILPLVVGISLRHLFSTTVQNIVKVFPAVSVLAIVVICAVVVALNQKRIVETSLILFSTIFLLNIIGYLGGFYGGKMLGQEPRRCRTLSIEIGMQNAGLGMVLALAHFSEEVALPSALFCIWCIITTSMMVKFWKGRDEKEVRTSNSELPTSNVFLP